MIKIYMKIQDLLFLAILIILVFKKNPKFFVTAGLMCLLFSMPLFSFWVFFTAERLVWYAFVFLLLAVLFIFTNIKNKKK